VSDLIDYILNSEEPVDTNTEVNPDPPVYDSIEYFKAQNTDLPAGVPSNVEVPSGEVDDFVNTIKTPANFQKSFRCAVCGGVYPRNKGVYSRGKWYCTILECSTDLTE